MLNDSDSHRDRTCPSPLALDKLRAGELATSLARALEAHVQSCPACADKQRSLDAAAAAYLVSPEARRTKRQIVREHAAPTGWAPRLALVCAAAAAAFALVSSSPSQNVEQVRRKGAVQLGFFVKRGERVFRGSDGERVRPGDLLRFTARPDRPVYLTIFSIDQRGVVSLYYPVRGAPQKLEPTRHELALLASVELDHVLGEERIVGVFCDQAQPIESLRRELETSRALQPPGCSIETLHLHKEPDRQ